MCLAVCPHGVFARNGLTVQLVQPEARMECGACQVNCPEDAIRVDSGIGWCRGMFLLVLLRKPTPSCG